MEHGFVKKSCIIIKAGMADKKIIKMKSKLGSEFDTEVIAGNKRYFVHTEDCGKKQPLIITHVYLNGHILLTRKTDYSETLGVSDKERKVQDLMRKQHSNAMQMVRVGNFREVKALSAYLDEVRDLLKGNSKRKALRLLGEALEYYPDDPFILSYHGCLDAIANKNYKEGIETCLFAIEILKKKAILDKDSLFPVCYLNLGRAYLAAGKKKEAITAFNKGLTIDSQQRDLLWEVRKLGIRRKPVVSFLKRSGVINRHIGRILHRLKK